MLLQQVGDEPVAPGTRAVVGRERGLAAEQARGLRVGAVAEPEQRRRLRRRAACSASLPDHERRDADAAADQHRTRARGGRAEADTRAGRRATPRRPGASCPSRSVPGPIASSRNSSRAGAGAAHGESAAELRAARGPAPPRHGGQHVELPGQRRRPALIGDADQVVRPDPLVRDHAARAPAERRQGARTLLGRGEPGLQLDAHEATGGVSASGAGCVAAVELLQRAHTGCVLRPDRALRPRMHPSSS